MGTRAITTLQNENDFIRLYTRWDGFEEEIKSDLKNIKSLWDDAVNEVASEIVGKERVYPILSNWVKEMQVFLNSEELSLEQVSLLMCAKSFSHHGPVSPEDDDEGADIRYDVSSKTFKKKKDPQCVEKLREFGVVFRDEEEDYCTQSLATSRTPEEVIKDLKDLSSFWSELSGVFYNKKSADSVIFKRFGVSLETLGGYARWEKEKRTLEGTIETADAVLSFPYSANTFSAALAISKPGLYEMETRALKIKQSLEIKVVNSRMPKFKIDKEYAQWLEKLNITRKGDCWLFAEDAIAELHAKDKDYWMLKLETSILQDIAFPNSSVSVKVKAKPL